MLGRDHSTPRPGREAGDSEMWASQPEAVAPPSAASLKDRSAGESAIPGAPAGGWNKVYLKGLYRPLPENGHG